MNSIVLELQRDALDNKVPVSDLLRKSLVVASKLNLKEFQFWIQKELNGYSIDDTIPEYRKVKGHIRGWNPAHGWIPIFFEDTKFGEKISQRNCLQSIAEFEHLSQNQSDQSSLHMPFSQEAQQTISQSFGFETEVSLFVDFSILIRVIDAVRTIVLNWALKLEEEGILGEELAFTGKEKNAAEKSSQNITNFYGPVQSSQIQQSASHSSQISVTLKLNPSDVQNFLNDLKEKLDTIILSDEKKKEMHAEICTIESQIKSPKPKTTIIHEGLESLRCILEGAGGSIVGQLLIELGKLTIF